MKELSYDECGGDVDAAVAALLAAGRLGLPRDDPACATWDFAALLRLLPLPLVRRLMTSCGLAPRSTTIGKPEAERALREARGRRRPAEAEASGPKAEPQGKEWAALKELLGGTTCVRLDPCARDAIARVQRLYFLDEGLDMARWVRQGTGVSSLWRASPSPG